MSIISQKKKTGKRKKGQKTCLDMPLKRKSKWLTMLDIREKN